MRRRGFPPLGGETGWRRGRYGDIVSHPAVKATNSGVTVSVWVVPGASRTSVDGLHGDHIKIRVASPPEDGRANAEVEKLLTEMLDSPVRLIRGMRGRSKVFEVTHSQEETVLKKLGL